MQQRRQQAGVIGTTVYSGEAGTEEPDSLSGHVLNLSAPLFPN